MARFSNIWLNSLYTNINNKSIHMKKIKRFRNGKINMELGEQEGKTIWVPYKPYKLCDIPSIFGCIEYNDERGGIPEWFNHKGLTYVLDK